MINSASPPKNFYNLGEVSAKLLIRLYRRTSESLLQLDKGNRTDTLYRRLGGFWMIFIYVQYILILYNYDIAHTDLRALGLLSSNI